MFVPAECEKSSESVERFSAPRLDQVSLPFTIAWEVSRGRADLSADPAPSKSAALGLSSSFRRGQDESKTDPSRLDLPEVRRNNVAC
jgi:hypothetical protein